MKALGVEVRVGLFVFAALAGLVVLVLLLGDVHFGRRFRVSVDFAYAGGLQRGAPVKIGGLRVGSVGGVELLAPGAATFAPPIPVRAHLELQPQAAPWLTEGTRFYAGVQGLVGEAYVEIVPAQAPGKPYIEDAVVRGIDAPQVHVLGHRLAGLVDLIAPDDGVTAVEDASTSSSPAGAIATLARDVGEVVRDNRTQWRQTFADAAATTADLRQVAGRLRQLFDDRGEASVLVRHGADSAEILARELPALLAQGRAAATAMAALSERLERSATPDLVSAISADLLRASRDLADAATQAAKTMEELRAGEGTLGALSRDKQLYLDLRALIDDLKQHPWKLLWRE